MTWFDYVSYGTHPQVPPREVDPAIWFGEIKPRSWRLGQGMVRPGAWAIGGVIVRSDPVSVHAPMADWWSKAVIRSTDRSIATSSGGWARMT